MKESYIVEMGSSRPRPWDKVPLYVIGAYFFEDCSRPDSVWGRYFVQLDRFLSSDEDYRKIFKTKSVHSFFPSMVTAEPVDDVYIQFKTIVQLRECAGECCKLVEINPDKDRFMTCSRCRKVQYCSAACQKADWKRHKTPECLPGK